MLSEGHGVSGMKNKSQLLYLLAISSCCPISNDTEEIQKMLKDLDENGRNIKGWA